MSNPNLSDYTPDMLEEYIFPGTDAAVIFVADGEKPPDEVRAVLERSSQQRWYPVPGGHKAKVPFWCAEGNEHLFERETKGWDHDHCSFCESRIAIGERAWIVKAQDGWHLFCRACYAKVQKRRWWQFWK